MKHVIRIGIAALAVLAAPLAAHGADLRRMPVTAYKAMPPVVQWTGCYVGLNIGGAWAKATMGDAVTGTGLDGVNSGGVIGGVQAGCDVQWGMLVFGVQAMADASDIRGSHLQPDGVTTNNLNIPWVETLTARVGVAALPSTLFYVKGGAAFVRDNVWTTFGGSTLASGIINPNGWTVGAGVEFIFFQNWSVFAEYGYLGFKSTQLNLINQVNVGVPINFNHSVQTFLIGVNYRFGGPFSPSY
jgi:outer membrane immunogenic protein